MDQSSEQSADRSWLTYPELAAARGIDKLSAIRLALLLVALPFVAHAQSLPSATARRKSPSPAFSSNSDSGNLSSAIGSSLVSG
jgi:hypothetical protein